MDRNVPTIDKLHKFLLLSLMSYIVILILIRDFFVKKLASTNLIENLICGDKSSITLSDIVFFTGLHPTW